MKDRQSSSAGAMAKIPVLSPVLHWMVLPVILFLRSGFGFSFLGPKSVFLSCIFPVALLFIYARTEPGEWERWRALSLFGIAASLLYVLHLSAAFLRERSRTGKHDFDAGTPHLLRLLGTDGNGLQSPRLEIAVQLWLEPAAVLLAALVLRTALWERFLSGWLIPVTGAMWLKAFINWWYGVRSEKKHTDIMDDAGEKMPDASGGSGGIGAGSSRSVPQAVGRKQRERRPRTAGNALPSPADAGEEQRFAQILRLMPPYELDQAERNHRVLLEQCRAGPHNDDQSGAQDGNSAEADLDAAIEYFRAQKAADREPPKAQGHARSG